MNNTLIIAHGNMTLKLQIYKESAADSLFSLALGRAKTTASIQRYSLLSYW